jgi:hypothetical protein
MWTQKPFHRKRIIVELCLTALLASAEPVRSMQAAENTHYAVESSPPRVTVFATRAPAPPKTKKALPPSLDRLPFISTKKIATEHITSFFIRANDSKRIQLSVLVTHKEEFTHAVRKLVQEDVTPLLFSVSTLPNRTINFNPALLRFEQRGRVWQPNGLKNSVDLWPLEEGGQFGGVINESQVHQGVILLPDWFEPAAPITVRYENFHYLARFVK